MPKAVIYIYDYIDKSYVSSKYIQETVTGLEAQGYDSFEIHINSPGGDVFEGIAIYNFLKVRNVEMYIDGLAGSMASVIAMAGKKVLMQSSALMMIHNPWILEMGDADYMRQVADALDVIKKAIVEAYVEKTKLPKAEVEKIMDESTWLTAAEAKKKGFCDEIIKQRKSGEKNYVGVYVMALDDEDLQNKKNKGNEMNKKFLAFLGLPETATEAEAQARLDAIAEGKFELKGNVYVEKQAAGSEGKTEAAPVQASAELPDEVKAIIAEFKAFKAQQAQNEINAVIENAVAQGKILPADKEIYAAALKTDFAGTKAKLEAKAKNSAMPGSVKVDENGAKPAGRAENFKAAVEALKAAGRNK